MFHVIIIQTLKTGESISAIADYEDKFLAISRYHSELAQVGISDALLSVSASVVDDYINYVNAPSFVTMEKETPVEPTEA